jgi:hypothetical protein
MMGTKHDPRPLTPLLDELAVALRGGDEARARALVRQLRQIADVGKRPADNFELAQ